MQNLMNGSFLQNGKYRIESVLGQGGFGITYLAVHVLLDKKVAIKEFFPKDFCDRNTTTSRVSVLSESKHELVNKLRAKFVKESRNLAKLDHPGIVKIQDVFEENDTAYYVMDYIEGISLNELVKVNGKLSESEAVAYISDVAEALNYIHSKNMMHLDIKPANIMVRKSDNRAILIDFGLAKQYDSEGNQTSTTPTGISHGYAPMEQYNDGGVKEFSPQTDIYSLAATLFYLLTGTVPPHASALVEQSIEIPNFINAPLGKAIKKALMASRLKRYKSVKNFMKSISSPVSDEPDLKETEEKEVGTQDPIIERTELVSEREVNGEVKIKDGENKPFLNDNAISEDSESKKTNSAFIIKIITIIVVIAGAITIGIVSNHNHGAEPSYDAADTICQADTMIVEVEPQDSVQLEIGSFSADAKANIPKKENSENSAATSDKDVNNRGNKEIVELRIVEDKANQGAKENEPVNVVMVEQKPSFPGGDAAMMKWLSENIQYPKTASDNGVEGRVTVQFIVEKDGSLSNVQVVRRKHPDLDAEAVRVVNEMPKWTPGRNNGQPIRVTYNLPMTFRLQK